MKSSAKHGKWSSMQMTTWWKAWGQFVVKVFSVAAALFSLGFGLIRLLPPETKVPWWATALFVLAGVFFVTFVILELCTHRGHHVYAQSDTNGIRNYMHKWIKHSGRVVIWTRDMSW